MRYLVALLMVVIPMAALAEEPKYPFGPVVELSGTITKVQVVRGQGMPFLEVEDKGQTTRVYLGSMRYLLQHDFSPSAGDSVEIEAFRRDENELVAKKVRLVDRGKTLDLRDDDGRPFWQGGRHGRGQARGTLETEGNP